MKTMLPQKLVKPKIRRIGRADLMKKLAGFEKKYDMSTEVFLKKVANGEIEDTHEVVRWLGTAEAYQELSKNGSYGR